MIATCLDQRFKSKYHGAVGISQVEILVRVFIPVIGTVYRQNLEARYRNVQQRSKT